MSDVVFGDFEWDAAKAASNLAKHGVSFEEAALAVEGDSNEVLYGDTLHPDRVVSLVLSPATRILLVVSIARGSRTRLMSARKATTHEQRIYEAG